MGTDKRARQKAARQAKIEELQQRERRSATKRRTTLIAGGVVAFIVIVIGFSILTSDDGGDDELVGAGDDTTDIDDGGDDTPTSTTDPAPVDDGIAGTPPPTNPPAAAIDPECPPAEGVDTPVYDFTGPFGNCLEEGVDYGAVFDTTRGQVVIDLREDTVPGVVNNFVALSRYGYYDNTDLFRTDPSIDIIQGGSPHTQNNADPGPGYTIPDEGGEFVTTESGQYVGPFDYLPGQLIMARSAGPDSSGAQFFFSTGPLVSNLDSQGTYLLFGDVTEGLDVLQDIMSLHVPTGGLGGRPSEYVIVNSVTITEN